MNSYFVRTSGKCMSCWIKIPKSEGFVRFVKFINIQRSPNHVKRLSVSMKFTCDYRIMSTDNHSMTEIFLRALRIQCSVIPQTYTFQKLQISSHKLDYHWLLSLAFSDTFLAIWLLGVTEAAFLHAMFTLNIPLLTTGTVSYCGSPPGVMDGWHTELHC